MNYDAHADRGSFHSCAQTMNNVFDATETASGARSDGLGARLRGLLSFCFASKEANFDGFEIDSIGRFFSFHFDICSLSTSNKLVTITQ